MTERTAPSRPRGTARKEATFDLLRRISVGIERLFAPHCEVVIHDFADLEHSIVDVQGSLSDRAVGGAATDLLLKQMRGGDTAQDLHCYRTQLASGKSLKSSTMFLTDDNGAVYGAFCVNFDVSPFVGMQRMLTTVIGADTAGNVSEALTDDINQTIGTIIAETIEEMEAATPFLTRHDKVALIDKLDQKGVFQVKKAISILADQVGCSKATVYNYLREARSKVANGAG